MLKLTEGKTAAMKRLSNESGLIEALAIDQRGALKKMMTALKATPDRQQIECFKKLVSEELTKSASAILLDPEYGLPAAGARNKETGLLLAYEKTGYDASTPGRLPDVLPEWSVQRLKAAGADAIKFLLYYDVDEDASINDQKQAFIERLGSECEAENLPFFLELLSYDATMKTVDTKEYAKIKPHKVNKMMAEFSNPAYKVDVLKVEIPVNMNYVAGFAKEEAVYSEKEAAGYFKAQSEATQLPFIFLSAGVSADQFQKTLYFAKESGSTFNGVLCGRATWKDSVAPFIEKGEKEARRFLQTVGHENIITLNKVIEQTASSWYNKVQVIKS